MIINDRQETELEVNKWFLEKAKEATTSNQRRRIIMKNESRKRFEAEIGKVYFFRYSAKWKGILPIWDQFPMVIPIEYYPDGILGLNLHYIPVPTRKVLLEQLLVYSNNKNMDNTTRMKLSYKLLSRAKNLTSWRPCIKRYLYQHLQSYFVEISPTEYSKAASLRTESWVRNK